MISQTVSISLKATFLLLSLFLLSTAHAAGTEFRAYLSSTGSDSNPCSLAQPCRLLPAALAAVQDGGDIWILDSANYNTGTVTISQNVAIVAVPGASASVLAINGDAIDIPGSSVSVTLRNISVVNLSGSSNVGVNIIGSNSQLNIERSQFSGLDIAVQANAPGAQLNAFDSTFLGNTYALYINGTTVSGATPAQAVVDRCTISNAAIHAIEVFYANVMIGHSKLASAGPNGANTDRYGVWAGEGANVMLESNVISQFQWAVALAGSGKVTSTVSNAFANNLFVIFDPNGNYNRVTHL